MRERRETENEEEKGARQRVRIYVTGAYFSSFKTAKFRAAHAHKPHTYPDTDVDTDRQTDTNTFTQTDTQTHMNTQT